MKKRWLNRYKKNREFVRRLNDRMQLLDEKITSVKTSHVSSIPRGGKPITKEDLIAEKLELESRIDKLNEKGKRYRHEILDAIDNLEEVNHVDLLESIFISCNTIEYAGEKLGYTVRHTYRIYAQALEMIVIPDSNIAKELV